MKAFWSEDLLRRVLAVAIRGDLLRRFPNALSGDLFGPPQAQSPRSRIAKAVAEYWEKWGRRPVPEVLEGTLREVAERLSEPEREALLSEFQWVLAEELPDDLQPIYDAVRRWVEYRRIEDALVEGKKLLEKGPDNLPAIRERVGDALRPLEAAASTQEVLGYQGGAEERLRLWRLGDEGGERIPTGLPELDRVLRGGPTRKEVFYFLAPPKGAKTASLLRVALGAARRRYGVFMVTYEMQAIRMALRMDRMVSRQSKEELREDTKRLEQALGGLRAAGAGELYLQEQPPQLPKAVEQVARNVDDIRRSGGIVDVVVLDYLNIMGSNRGEREKRHELARISREMAAMARELGVLVWSAALVKRASVNKQVIRKTDIAEAFEVIAVADGMIAICASPAMVENRLRGFYVTAAREEEDEVLAGYYNVDFARMMIDPVEGQPDLERVARILREERDNMRGKRGMPKEEA